MQQYNNRKSARKCKGVTLIETLVTVLVLSVGLLGLAGMHMQGLKNNQSAYFRSQATILAYSIVESMRANRNSAVDEDYDIAFTEKPDTVDTVADQDLSNWKTVLENLLPTGDGSIDCQANVSICRIIVQWDDTIGEGGIETQQFAVTTQL